jgi:hypothetical protein
VEVASDQEAYFTCSSGSIVIDIKDITTKTSDEVILGNTRTLQTRSITGLGQAERDRADNELGLDDDSGIQSRAGVPSNSCLTGSAPTTYVNSDYLAHGNVDICYGRFIVRGGIPVEVVWSDLLTYIMRQNLSGTRTIQTFALENISTNQAYEIGVDIQWNQRVTEFGSDDWVSGPETVEMLPFPVGHQQTTEYYPSHAEGTYHLTNDYTTIHVNEGPSLGADLLSHPNLRMPDFECPALGSEPYQCTF